MTDRIRRQLRRLNGVVALLVLLGPLYGGPAGRVAAQAVPSAIVSAVDDAGNPVLGACFMALERDAVFPFQRYGNGGAICDGADGAVDGLTAFTNLYQSGSYVLYQVVAAEGFLVGARTAFDYVEGQSAQLIVNQKQGGETLTISTSVEGGGVITEGCFYLARDNGIGFLGQPAGWGCVPDGSTDGVVRIGGLPTGDYAVQPPFAAGVYVKDSNIRASVRSGKENTLNFPFVHGSSGSIAVAVVDEVGTPVLANVCLSVRRTDAEQAYSAGACDDFDQSTPGSSESDGIVLISGVPNGAYDILPNPTPPGYRIAKNSVHATVQNGAQAKATFTLKAGGQTLTIISQSDSQGTANGGCFLVHEAKERLTADDWLVSGCLSAQPDNTMSSALSVPAGKLVITQSLGRSGAAPAPDQFVTVGKGENVTVTFAPVDGGLIAAQLTDEAGRPIKNGCAVAIGEIEGYHGGGSWVFGEPDPASCDIDDGIADGRILIHWLPAGKYTVLPITVPRGYALPDPASVAVKAGKTTKVGLAASKGGARLTVAVDDANTPAQNQYCVAVYENAGGKPGARVTQRCDWFSRETATIEFAGLPDGDYLVALDPWGLIVALPEVAPVPVTVTGGKDATTTIAIPKASE